MASVRVLVLSVTCAVIAFVQLSGAMVVTGVCSNDVECLESRGNGFCCAPLNPNAAMTVCKPPGQAGDLCHVISNIMPYPWAGARKFWRCACAEGMRCVPNQPRAKLGRCTVL